MYCSNVSASKKEKFGDLLGKIFDPPTECRPSLLTSTFTRMCDSELCARYEAALRQACERGELRGLCGDAESAAAAAGTNS